jgi:hypothetical protein
MLLLLPALAAAAAPPSAVAPLTLLQDPSAKCMDGTPGGFYLRPGSQSSKWILTLQGGGECVTKARCTKSSQGHLGSSSHFPSNFSFWRDGSAHFIDANCSVNPSFCEYNLVYLPYCSQDLWSGQRREATADTFGFFFSGHLILRECTFTAAWRPVHWRVCRALEG